MRWEKSPPTRQSSFSKEDWDLIVEDEELEVVGFVSLVKDGWRAIALVGDASISMHLTKEDAMEACMTELVKWRLRE